MRNDEKNVINFKEIFSLIFRRLWLIILFALCGGVIAFCVSKYIITPKYESHLNLYVQSSSSLVKNANGTAEKSNDVNNLKQLTNTYIEVLNDDLVMQDMGSELVKRFGEERIKTAFTLDSENNIPADELRSTIFIESVPDTLVLKLKSVTKDPEVSVAICNYFAVYSNQYLQKAIGADSVAKYMTWAKYNDHPVSPNKIKNTALGIIAGILISLLIIFIMDFFDDSVRNVNTLSNRYGTAVIGEVGHFKSRFKSGDRKSRFVSLFNKYVPFTVVENYKAIRTSLIYSLSHFDNKVISVSSAEPFEGKSITAANIAITLAQGGNKVLLVDADLRNPVQHEIFRISEKNGLANALSSGSDMDRCIKKTFMSHLDIITAGDAVSNPSELVASENMDKLIEKLGEKYAYIIIDTPAVNFFTDAVEIAKKVSGMVMVVRHNDTSSADIDSAMSRIEFFEANMLGFIMNDVKSNKKYNKFVAPNRSIEPLKKMTDAQMKNRNSSTGSKNRNTGSSKPKK